MKSNGQSRDAVYKAFAYPSRQSSGFGTARREIIVPNRSTIIGRLSSWKMSMPCMLKLEYRGVIAYRAGTMANDGG